VCVCACVFVCVCLCVESDLIDGFVAGVLQAQVDHGVLERPAHVELQRQIIHPLEERRERCSETA